MAEKGAPQTSELAKEGFEALNAWLRRLCPRLQRFTTGRHLTVSRGCFAQAWSVTELLRAVYDYERM